jgi:hypothetical protein
MKIKAVESYADPSARASFTNRRGSARQQSSERLFAQIVLSEQVDGNSLGGATLRCTTVDCSPQGIAFVAERPIPIGAMVDIWLDTRTRPGKMFLSGQVCWCSAGPTPNADSGHQVGVQLLSSPATDLQEWQSILS